MQARGVAIEEGGGEENSSSIVAQPRAPTTQLLNGSRLEIRCGDLVLEIPWTSLLSTKTVADLKRVIVDFFPQHVGENTNNILLSASDREEAEDAALLASYDLSDGVDMKLKRHASYVDFVGRLLTKRRSMQVLYWCLVTGIGALFIAAMAQLSFFFPWDKEELVPVTFQTFGILLIGALFGSLLGGCTATLYLLLGLVGAPFYAGGGSGVKTLAGPSGGYLVGFVVAGFLTGFLAEKGFDRTWRKSVVAMFAGNIILYCVAIPWLAVYESSLKAALIYNLRFLPGDLFKIILAALLLPVGWKIIARRAVLFAKMRHCFENQDDEL